MTGRRRGYRPVLAVAGLVAALAFVAAIVVVVADDDEPTDVVGGRGREAGIVAIELGGAGFVLLDEGLVRGDRCVTLVVDGRRRGRTCVPTQTPGMTIDAATVGARTAVFGVGHRVSHFSGQVTEVGTATHEEVAVGEGAAFLTVWDVADASGFVEGLATDGTVHTGSFGDDEPARDLVDYGAPLPPTTAEPPATLVAVTPDGRLVVVDRASGNELRELARYGNPQEPLPPEGVAPTVIDAVDVSPDGHWAWFSLCCEPAGGTVLRVPIDGSRRPQRVADGYDPTFGSSARFVATATIFGLDIVDTVGDRGRSWVAEEWHGEYQETAWSLDAQTLVVRVGMPDAGRLAIVALAGMDERSDAGSPSSRSGAAVLPGEAWSGPAFRRDGSLVAFDHDTGRLRTIDPRSREPDRGIDLGGTVADLAYDASGEWLLVVMGTDAEGGAASIQLVDPHDGSLTAIGGTYRAAAW